MMLTAESLTVPPITPSWITSENPAECIGSIQSFWVTGMKYTGDSGHEMDSDTSQTEGFPTLSQKSLVTKTTEKH